ncbi:uncharacterized protein LOC110268372 [Arachis ipaensis]|uniref:uncharacterized protein LOC110268372 n=1 Tax=Arachis ipaensis TaxID=130454 RepID=UPI000A2B0AF1|nr:uncharacterized protein LOC110268372 [Arachis ipaensis]
MLADILCAKIYSSASKNDQIYFLIGEIIDVLKHQKWWYYCCLCNAPVCHVGNVFYYYLCRIECVDAIRRYLFYLSELLVPVFFLLYCIFCTCFSMYIFLLFTLFRYRIKIIVSHSNSSNIFILEDDEVMQILKKSCSDFLIDERNFSQSKDDYTVPNSMISQLMNDELISADYHGFV